MNSAALLCRLTLLALLTTIVTATLGCSRRTPETGSQPVLAVHLSSEPVSLDPALAEDGISLRVLANTMEGLLGYDSEGNLQNRLAENYRASPDRKRYEFQLRKNARWSDGSPVTVEQFVSGFRRSLGPDSISKLAPLLFMIRGAEKYQKGLAQESNLGVFEKNGWLVLELERPAPHLLHALTLPVAFPARADVLSANSGKWPMTAPCTGSYFIASHLPDRKIQLQRNPHHYSPDVNAPERVDLIVVNDETTAANLFEQGKLDILTKLPPSDYARMKKSGRVRTDPFLATYFLSFNTRKAPFNSAAARRAVSRAIDREQVVSVLQAGEQPAYGWIPPGLEGSIAAVSPTPSSTDKTDKELKLDQVSPVVAGFDGNTRNSLIMQKVQQDLLQKLGLRLQLQNTDWKSHIRSLQTDPPQIYRFGWQAPFRDPISHLRAFTSDDPNNYTGWKSPVYDRLVREIEKLPPDPAREKLIIRAQKLLVDSEAAVVPIYHYVQNHAVAARVRGFRANPLGMIFFRELRIGD